MAYNWETKEGGMGTKRGGEKRGGGSGWKLERKGDEEGGGGDERKERAFALGVVRVQRRRDAAWWKMATRPILFIDVRFTIIARPS